MGKVIKQSAYASVINYLGVIIGAVNMIFLYPLFLEQKELGLFKAIFSMAIILSPFAQLGLARSTLRFFPRFNKGPKSSGRFLSFILITAFFTITGFILVFQLIDDWVFGFFEKNAPELIDQYWLILILAALLVYIAIFESYFKSLLNVTIPTFMREFFLRVISGLLAFIYFSNYISFEWFLRLSIASYALSLVVLCTILIYKNQLRLNFSIFHLNSNFIKEITQYMVFIMAGAVGSVIVLQIDQLMVTGYLGFEQNAIYVMAFFMATVIEIPKRSISQMADAIIANAFENERLDEVKKIYKQSSINQLIIGCFVFLLIVLNLDNIYAIMPAGEMYAPGKLVVIIIGIAKIIDMGFGVNSELIISSKHYKSNIYLVLILAALTIILNILLIPKLGLIGAALATMASLLLFNIIKLIFIYRQFNFQPFSKHTVSTLLLSLISFLIIFFLPSLENPILNTAFISVTLTFVFGVLVLILRPSREVSGILRNLLSRLKS